MRSVALTLLSTAASAHAWSLPSVPPTPPAIIRVIQQRERVQLGGVDPRSPLQQRLSEMASGDLKATTQVPLPCKKHFTAKRVLNLSPLFGPNGPQPEDVMQGDAGDCYLLAVLASLAKHQPELLTAIINSPDRSGTAYKVEYIEPNSGARTSALIFNTAYVDKNNRPIYVGDREGMVPSDGVSWVKLMENWFAKIHQQYGLLNKRAGFNGIAHGGYAAVPFKLLTGKNMEIFRPDSDDFSMALDQVDDHKVVIWISKANTFPEKPFRGVHAYAVLEKQGDAVTLYDPYGRQITLDWASLIDNSAALMIESE